MTKNEQDPYPNSGDGEFDGVIAESYSNPETELAVYVDNFFATGDMFNVVAEQFIRQNWDAIRYMTNHMEIEKSFVSHAFSEVVKNLASDDSAEYAAREIANIIELDRSIRVGHFTKISVVEFEKFSSEDEMSRLFLNMLSADYDFDNKLFAIVSFYNTMLMSQLKSLVDAKMKH